MKKVKHLAKTYLPKHLAQKAGVSDFSNLDFVGTSLLLCSSLKRKALGSMNQVRLLRASFKLNEIKSCIGELSVLLKPVTNSFS